MTPLKRRVGFWFAFCLPLIGASAIYFGRSLPMNEGLLLYEAMLFKQREVEANWKLHNNFEKEPPTVVAKYEDYGFLVSVSDLGVIRGENQDGTVFINLRPDVNGSVLAWTCDGSKAGGIPSGCDTDR